MILGVGRAFFLKFYCFARRNPAPDDRARDNTGAGSRAGREEGGRRKGGGPRERRPAETGAEVTVPTAIGRPEMEYVSVAPLRGSAAARTKSKLKAPA